MEDEEWETPEEKEAFDAIKNQETFFAGNYEGPLYSPHPDIIKSDISQTKEN